MKEALINLGTLLLVLTSLFLKSAIKILTVMIVLWMIGAFYPTVARALGVPQQTVYELILSLINTFKALISAS